MPYRDVEAPDHVEATLHYLRPTDGRPATYAAGVAPLPGRQAPELDPRRVRIRNARKAAQAATLDAQGFSLHEHRSAVADFSDERALREVYYPEAQGLIRALTGASEVVIFDHTLRLDLAAHAEPGVREPVRRIHNDQTFLSAPRRVRDHLARGEAELRLSRRFAIINLWRPIGVPAWSTPLALCEAGSLTPRELVPTDLVYPDKVGETYSVLFSPEHRWHYFPAMQPDEVLLLKIFDSRSDGTAKLTAHTAFDDPSAPAGVPPRRSIELRTLVFW
jgi:hypothetical protein